MPFGRSISVLNYAQKSAVRRVESTSKKIINAEIAVFFNQICLQENLLPKYTNIKLHDPAVRNVRFTQEYRRRLIQHQMETKGRDIISLQDQLRDAEKRWNDCVVPQTTRDEINLLLEEELDHHRRVAETRTRKKLFHLNRGHLKSPNTASSYINLTNKTLTQDQEELLNLGLNCHVFSKPRPWQKRLEIEILLDNIHLLAKDGKVTTEEGLHAELLREAKKNRGNYNSRIIEKKHIEAAKTLREDPEVTIRRADKAANYVLLPTDDYLTKIDAILNDDTKFQRITKNPTEEIKRKVNKVVDTINAKTGGLKLAKLVGDYGLGYCYGNVKTHKPGYPLRPIISQIPTPSYKLAKKLNELLTPFIPCDYSLTSATNFIDLLSNSDPEGVIASLDAENLFTNVPVNRTIQYILKEIYPENDVPKLDLPKAALKTLLEICTMEAPFICPRGKMFRQIDGVAMGSPIGVLFANFFMGMVEREIFSAIDKPAIYARYIDDIFVKMDTEEDLEILKEKLQEISGLNFTIESSDGDKLPFLDVLVQQSPTGFKTSVYTKPTNPGLCLNGISECPQRYKDSTVRSYIKRALSHSSSWSATHQEIERATQVLVNNGYPDKDINRVVKNEIDKWYHRTEKSPNPSQEGNRIKVFYKAHMHSNYDTEERIMRQIIKTYVKPTRPQDTLDVVIYYKNKKTSSLLMKNNPTKRTLDLQRSHLVYEYKCNIGNCESLPSSYIGYSTTKLSRRLTLHLQNGTPKTHTITCHNTPLTRQMMEENTKIIGQAPDMKRLQILEALFIKEKTPKLNLQTRDFAVIPSSKSTPSDARNSNLP